MIYYMRRNSIQCVVVLEKLESHKEQSLIIIKSDKTVLKKKSCISQWFEWMTNSSTQWNNFRLFSFLFPASFCSKGCVQRRRKGFEKLGNESSVMTLWSVLLLLLVISKLLLLQYQAGFDKKQDLILQLFVNDSRCAVSDFKERHISICCSISILKCWHLTHAILIAIYLKLQMPFRNVTCEHPLHYH